MKIIFLVSGNGGNFKFIKKCIDLEFLKDIELIVIADRECGALQYAKENKIQSSKIKYNREYTKELSELLNKINPDYIITNWNKIIDEITVKKYSGKMINLHYSLLPAFGGVIGIKPIEQAFEKKCRFIGSTLHYVNENVDDGEIIAQASIPNNFNKKEMINQVFRSGCLNLLNFLSGENERIKIEYGDIYFSPRLSGEFNGINEFFWEGI